MGTEFENMIKTILTGESGDGTGFCQSLISGSKSQDIPEIADIYGWLIGSWELVVIDHRVDGHTLRNTGEAHFSWALEGRAIQDVWIIPRRTDRQTGLSATGNRYGTTLRVWDSSVQAWRITWINPVSGRRDELIGRKSGHDIVQIGIRSDGTPIRWSFTEITDDSFKWLGEALQPDGRSWTLETEFKARRMNKSSSANESM